MEKRRLKSPDLGEFLSRLASGGRRVFVPRKAGGKVDFGPWSGPGELVLDHVQTVESAKRFLLPRVEELFRYEAGPNGMELRGRDLASIPERVVFGVRPCDAAAIGSLQAVFNWDYRDGAFNARVEKTAFVGLSCERADGHCFCTSVGLGPGGTAGSDILLTRLGSGDFLAEVVTEKGARLVEAASGLFGPAPEEPKEGRLAEVPRKFDVEDLRKKLAGNFASPLWEEQSLRCLGCGACAFLCPACACFDIQDEGTASRGKRLRCWDACGFGLFTLHTSGHNPRPSQGARWRQRVLHKFSYMPERLGVTGCVGCGRCSRACPADMELLEHLQGMASA